MAKIVVHLSHPAFPPQKVTRGVASINIHKIGANRYNVDRAQVKRKTTVKWEARGFVTPEIVVYFPGYNGPLVNPLLQMDGAPGIYQYGLFVKIGQSYVAVEGNSPPEMVIE